MSDGAAVIALSRADANTVPYKTKPCDKAGIPMPERLWELAKSCFTLNAAERPAVTTIAANLSEMMQRNWSFGDLAAGGSTTAVHPRMRSSGSTPSASPDKIHPHPVMEGKGKKHVHFAEEHAIVRFGPLQLDGADVKELFDGILAGLLKLLPKDVLTAPLAVDKHNSQYLHLQFPSRVEAHNFEMTWRAYCYDSYKEVSAVLVDN
jgi:hypothetical protein